jgi:hypothetical protein
VVLVRTDVSEVLSSSETSVLTRAISEDAILRSHRRENLLIITFLDSNVHIYLNIYKYICGATLGQNTKHTSRNIVHHGQTRHGTPNSTNYKGHTAEYIYIYICVCVCVCVCEEVINSG